MQDAYTDFLENDETLNRYDIEYMLSDLRHDILKDIERNKKNFWCIAPAENREEAPHTEHCLILALTECEERNAGEQITVFEITTAAGLLLFSRHPADVLLLEVGLGGRLDATNVVERPRWKDH